MNMFARHFDWFAVKFGALSERSELVQGKFANQRPVKMASNISGLDLRCFYFVFLRYGKTTVNSNHTITN